MAERRLVIANLGTPAAPNAEAVRAFLAEFLADPEVVDFPRWLWGPVLHGVILRRRPARVAHAYQAIWTADGSPLDVETRAITRAVAARLGSGWVVRHAYRYGAPNVATAVEEGLAAGAPEVVLLPLFPQRTGATTGTLIDLARAAAGRAGAGDRLRIAQPPPDGPGFVAALADRVRAACGAERPERLVLSYHGIPVRYDRREGRVYTADCTRTTEALLRALDWPAAGAVQAYQSRFGPERWLGPATAERLGALPAEGVRSVAVVMPGFVTDGLETIEEIGLRGSETFAAAGGTRFVRVPAVADHPAFIDEIARLCGPA